MALFNAGKENQSGINPNTLNIINSGTSITGEVNTDADMRIDGSVKGYVHSKARLVLGQSSKIEGDIKAVNLEVGGVVNGNLIVSELLTIKSTAKINGDITSGKLIIEAGAEFNGKCSMREAQNTIRKSEQYQPQPAQE